MFRKLTVVASLLMLSVSAFAQVTAVPNSMNFQGRLARPDGIPVPNGTYSIRFSLWNALTSGTEKWNKTVANVQVKNGTFAVTLDAFPAGTFNGNLWLETKIGSDAALAPRQPLVSVAYAMKAGSVADGSITNASLAGGITADKFASNIFNPLAWLLNGNSGVTSGFLGTVDENPLEFRVNGRRAMRYSYAENTATAGSEYRSMNVLSGSEVNSISVGVVGATIAGGGLDYFTRSDASNQVIMDFGTVGGGAGNAAGGYYATVGGGYYNSASDYATVGGGYFNIASNNYATVGGGRINIANNYDATVAGGELNTASGFDATVGGGYNNNASNNYATVAGGQSNTASGSDANIGGGYGNTASGNYSTVGGGELNTSGFQATVAGGYNNNASGFYTAIGGGRNHSASGETATIGGGDGNTAGGAGATVGGGGSNSASGAGATIGGGFNNHTSANFATIAGGAANTANGISSMAAGNGAQALHTGTFVWKSDDGSYFSSTGIRQFLISASGGVGINTNNPAGFALNVSGTVKCTSLTQSSDARFKHNIADLANPLDSLLHLHGVSYEWKQGMDGINAPDGKQIGFIAQEVEKILPELVVTDKSGYKSVNYVGVVPVLVEAVKAQQKELNAKDARISELEKRLDAIERALAEKR